MRNNHSPLFKQNNTKNQSFNLFNKSKQTSPFAHTHNNFSMKQNHNQNIFNNLTPTKNNNMNKANIHENKKSIFDFNKNQNGLNTSTPSWNITGASNGIQFPNPKNATNNANLNMNMNGNINTSNEFQNQLEKRDRRIQMLENQVKMLNQNMIMCIKYINEQRNYQTVMPVPNKNFFTQTATNYSNSSLKNNNNINNYHNLNTNKQLQIFGKPIMVSSTQIMFEDQQYAAHIKKIIGNININEVLNLKIENQQGKIIFSQPVNLSTITTDTRMHKWVQITNRNVQILVKELKNKKFQAYINNFMNYQACATATEKQIIVDQVNQSKKNNKFQVVQFDYDTGMLYVKCKGL